MLSIAICDDEILDCCNITKEIKDSLENMRISHTIRQFYSSKDLLAAVEDFDIIFLDIMMNDIDGMKTARLLREKAFHNIIVFVSSSRDYVMDAFDVEAFYYLTKPVDKAKLQNIIERAARKLTRTPEEFIIISKDRQRKKMLLRDILYFEIRGRVVSVHSLAGTFDYYEQIGSLEQTLDRKGFVRCHKSFLVNLRYVDTYNREEVILANGEKIVIAKRRYETFCQRILDYMKENGGYL